MMSLVCAVVRSGDAGGTAMVAPGTAKPTLAAGGGEALMPGCAAKPIDALLVR